MSVWHWLTSRLAGILRRRNRMQDFERELQSHLEMEAEEQQERGISPGQSVHAARRAFGNLTLVTENVRELWGVAWWDGFLRDLHHAFRALRKNPGFTVVAILTLALGTGANAAIFSAIDALMLKPLPFIHSEQLVRLFATKNGEPIDIGGGGPSPLDVRDYAQACHSFQQLVAYDTWRKNVSFGDAGGDPEQMRVGLVPAAYFQVLGIQPMMGRFFTEDENREGKNHVASISAHLWRTRYAGDPAILGRKIRINDEPYTIVAVIPDVIPSWMNSGNAGPAEVWSPFAFDGVWSETARGDRGYQALGRLKPGATVQQAQNELSTAAAGLAAAYPLDQGISVVVRTLADTRVGTLRPKLFLLMGAVSLILLIACVNLANLLLARNASREREMAVRAALGCGRGGLVRHLLAETLLLSLLGAAVGIGLARIGLAVVSSMYPEDFPQLGAMTIDWRVLAATLAISLLACLLFGLAPALTGTRLNLVDALKEGGRSATSGVAGQRMRSILVGTEIAMSLMLLVGASLLVQTILHLQRQSLGIRADHLLKGHFYLPGARYPNPGTLTRFCDEFGRRVRAIPGVVEATVTTIYPPDNGWTQMLGLPGHLATRAEDIPLAQFGVTDAHFVSTMGIPLLRGRDFTESDNADSPSVALISQEFSRRYFPAEDPIGRQIHIGPPAFLQIAPGADITDAADVTIVGVIGDFRNAGLVRPPEPQILVLYAQHPVVNYGFKDIVIRTTSEPRLLGPEIRRQLHQLDADMPFAQVQTIGELVREATGEERVTAILLACFAGAGLCLAAVGVYGVVSFLVAQRRQELAVRLALGASPGRILRLILKESLLLAATGTVVGLIGAVGAQRLIRGLLFGVSPVDPFTLASAGVFLVAVAALASAIPGTRVLQIDPARALRQD